MGDNIRSNISHERLISVCNVSGTNQELLALSGKFPNVLFYASNTNVASNNNKDLYLGGYKYTRFHGIGKSSVVVGENRIMLAFDENTGLLSILLNSSIDAFWLFGIDDTNSITANNQQVTLRDIQNHIFNDNKIKNYTYEYKTDSSAESYNKGLILYNRENPWNNNNFKYMSSNSQTNNDSATLLFGILTQSDDIPNIEISLQNNSLVKFDAANTPFEITKPESNTEERTIFDNIIGQLLNYNNFYSDDSKLFVCPIKVSILNSGVLRNISTKVDPNFLIANKDPQNESQYISNFGQNASIDTLENPETQESFTPNIINVDSSQYDTENELSTYKIFDSRVNIDQNITTTCNIFVESTISKITLNAVDASDANKYKYKISINAEKNTEFNTILFDNDALFKFFIENNILSFIIKMNDVAKKLSFNSTNNRYDVNGQTASNAPSVVSTATPSSSPSPKVTSNPQLIDDFGYIQYNNNDKTFEYINESRFRLDSNGLKTISILLVSNVENDIDQGENGYQKPILPLIKFYQSKESSNRLLPLFIYGEQPRTGKRLTYFVQPPLSFNDATYKNTCVSAKDLVSQNVQTYAYVVWGNFGNINDELVLSYVNSENHINIENGSIVKTLNSNPNSLFTVNSEHSGKDVLVIYPNNNIIQSASIDLMSITRDGESTYVPISNDYVISGNTSTGNLSWICIKNLGTFVNNVVYKFS